jgi:hypothetical protein
MCRILIANTSEKNLRRISCPRFLKTSKWSSGKDYSLCNVPLWFKCRIVIVQAREKRLRWISGTSLQLRANGLVVTTTPRCVMYHCGSSPTQIIRWPEMGGLLIIAQTREKLLRWISSGRFPPTSKSSSGKEYRLCNVPLWFKSYKSHFVTWNVANINCTSYKKPGYGE